MWLNLLFFLRRISIHENEPNLRTLYDILYHFSFKESFFINSPPPTQQIFIPFSVICFSTTYKNTFGKMNFSVTLSRRGKRLSKTLTNTKKQKVSEKWINNRALAFPHYSCISWSKKVSQYIYILKRLPNGYFTRSSTSLFLKQAGNSFQMSS